MYAIRSYYASLVIWPSLLDAAERHDVNLICFPGGRLKATDSFEIQRNAIFDLVSHKCLDGLITWSSSLGGVLGPAEIRAFHQRYHPLPMVSLAHVITSYSIHYTKLYDCLTRPCYSRH